MTEDELDAIAVRVRTAISRTEMDLHLTLHVVRTDAPALIAEVRRLRLQVEALEGAMAEGKEAEDGA